MEKEIMKSVVARDVDALRTIFMQAHKGYVYVKPDLLNMVKDYIKQSTTNIF